MRSASVSSLPWVLAAPGLAVVVLAVAVGTSLGTWVDEHSSPAVTNTFPSALPVIALGGLARRSPC